MNIFSIQNMKAASSGCDKPLGPQRQDQEIVLSNSEFEIFMFFRWKDLSFNPVVAFSNFWA